LIAEAYQSNLAIQNNPEQDRSQADGALLAYLAVIKRSKPNFISWKNMNAIS
jgi:hypothetical protein